MSRIQSIKSLIFFFSVQDGAAEMVLGFIQGVVPVLLIALFYLVLPYVSVLKA